MHQSACDPLAVEKLSQAELEQLATTIKGRGMAMPVVFSLELLKPISTLLYTACAFGAPLFSPLLGFDNSRKLTALLHSRESQEQLMRLIESKAE